MHIYTDVYDISAYKMSFAQLLLLFSYRRQTGVSEMYRVVQKSPYRYLSTVFHCERRRLCVATLSISMAHDTQRLCGHSVKYMWPPCCFTRFKELVLSS